MATTPTPIFTQTPSCPCVQLSTANTNTDGSTGTYSTAITFGANGNLVDYIKFVATGTPTTGILRIFYADDGSTYRLWDQVSYTTPGAEAVLYWIPGGSIPWNTSASAKVKFAVTVSENWNVFVHQSAY